MSQPRPNVFRAPTLRLTPVREPHGPFFSRAQIEQLSRRAQRTDRLDASELSRLARESFEAGYAAGAAQALSRSSADERVLESASQRARAAQQAPPPTARPASRSASVNPIASLSPRRLQVLELVARGLTNPEIASVLGISANTVKAHLTSILEALDLTNRTEAAMALQEHERELQQAREERAAKSA